MFLKKFYFFRKEVMLSVSDIIATLDIDFKATSCPSIFTEKHESEITTV